MLIRLSVLTSFSAISIIITSAYAMDSELFDIKESDSKEKIIQHFKSKLKDAEIKVEVLGQDSKDKFTSITFDKPQTFNISASDKFESIEAPKQGDFKNSEIILGEPKTGRVFHLNTELKLFKLDVLQSWESKNKLKTLREIVSEMSETKIVPKVQKKKGARK
jgi:hypothetical protein